MIKNIPAIIPDDYHKNNLIDLLESVKESNNLKLLCFYADDKTSYANINNEKISEIFSNEINNHNKKYIYFSLALIKFEEEQKIIPQSSSSSLTGGNSNIHYKYNNFNFKYINNIVSSYYLNDVVIDGGNNSYFSSENFNQLPTFIKNQTATSSVTYEDDMIEKINYFPTPDKITELKKQFNLYNFKRYFKGLTTDTFMQSLK